MNKIPYYNAHYDDPQYMADHQMHVARKNYGSSQQTFIIDGSGVYITRNSSTYSHGQFLDPRRQCCMLLSTTGLTGWWSTRRIASSREEQRAV